MNKRDPFENFTQRARQVMELAQEEAHLLQHDYVGTEHILLGLMHDEEIGARMMQRFDFDLEKLRAAIIELVGRGDHEGTDTLPLNEEAQQAVAQVQHLASQLDPPQVKPAHLLGTFLGMPSGVARRVLVHLNAVPPFQAMPTQSASTMQAADTATTAQGQVTPSSRDRFDKFNEQARQTLMRAQVEAQRFQHNYIGTEHLLLGLIRVEDGVAAQVLHELGVELEKVRNAVEFIIGRGDRIVPGEIRLTPRAKKVIELSVDESLRLKHHYIGTEHILLGLIREGEGIAAGVLESQGIRLAEAREKTLEVLKGESES